LTSEAESLASSMNTLHEVVSYAPTTKPSKLYKKIVTIDRTKNETP
jgi:hypothetical protein